MIALGRHGSLQQTLSQALNTMITHSVVGLKPKKFDLVHQTVSPLGGGGGGGWSGHETRV